jgi:X-X-X-Leu-X-X-Gly heptad repeat protein
MNRGLKRAALVAVAVGLLLVPATNAAAAGSRASAREQAQNHRISKVIDATRKISVQLGGLSGGIRTLGETVASHTNSIADLKGQTGKLDSRLKVIEGAAPQILDALTKLKDGLTQAADGLTKLKTLATSTEYGFGQLIVLTPGPQAEAGSFVETPDIPDAVQQAQTEQQFVAQHSGNLAVSYGVRSAESDGTGSSNPAALCKVTVTNQGGTTQTTAANPSLGGLPFQPVNNKSALTSTDPANAGFPFGLKTNGPDADQTTTFVSTVPVAAGATYTVGLSCVDTSPDPNDPSA